MVRSAERKMLERVVGLVEKMQSDLEGYVVGLMTLVEAAEYLKVSKGFIYKLTSRNEIPFHKPHGKLIYFLKRDIDGWALRNRSKTMEELEADANT